MASPLFRASQNLGSPTSGIRRGKDQNDMVIESTTPSVSPGQKLSPPNPSSGPSSGSDKMKKIISGVELRLMLAGGEGPKVDGALAQVTPQLPVDKGLMGKMVTPDVMRERLNPLSSGGGGAQRFLDMAGEGEGGEVGEASVGEASVTHYGTASATSATSPDCGEWGTAAAGAAAAGAAVAGAAVAGAAVAGAAAPPDEWPEEEWPEEVANDVEEDEHLRYTNGFDPEDDNYLDDFDVGGPDYDDDDEGDDEFAGFTMASADAAAISPEILRRKSALSSASPSAPVTPPRSPPPPSYVSPAKSPENLELQVEDTHVELIDVSPDPDVEEGPDTADPRISSGEMRNLLAQFGGSPDPVPRRTTSSLPTLGPVIAGGIDMLGPWVDMDEEDVMYMVPRDKKTGKVIRKRRRSKSKRWIWRQSLARIDEGGAEDKREKRKGKEPKPPKEAAPPTVEDILYGFGREVTNSSNNAPQPAAPAAKPKTPTKPRAARFNRRGNKIVSRPAAPVADKENEMGGTVELEGTLMGGLKVKVASPERGKDTYAMWFDEQVGVASVDEGEEDGSRILAGELFGAVKRKDLGALESRMGDADAVKIARELRDDYGNSLLAACCHSGFKRGVKLFVKSGWDVNHRNQFGNTGMHFAIERGHGKIAEFLKRKGGDETVRNEMGLCCYERVSTEEGEEGDVGDWGGDTFT
jgi:hypothetical protein